MTETMQPLATEARKRPRFRMCAEVHATFAGAPAAVINVSGEGLALRHEALIKVGSSGSIRIESAENSAGITFRGRVRWSHISRTPTAKGSLQYDSGIQIEDVNDAVAGLLGRLIRAHGEKDVDSLQRKQEAAERKAMNRATPSPVPAPRPPRTITRDQILLIREACVKVTSSPDDAQRWYERARQSLERRETPVAGPHRRDVLSVWEYLGGTIDPEIITAVLDAQNA